LKGSFKLSAFVVTKKHIDSILSIALYAVNEAPAARGLWYSPRFGNYKVEVYSADAIGLALTRECETSVNYRYKSDSELTSKFFASLRFYPFTAVEALKIVRCYAYQSCEHPAWETSAAKQFCDGLTATLISSLPGYDVATWAIS
jgi:hypothetical protein